MPKLIKIDTGYALFILKDKKERKKWSFTDPTMFKWTGTKAFLFNLILCIIILFFFIS